MNLSQQSAGDEVTDFAPVDLYQKREKIITRNVQGKFQRLQLFTGWPLLFAYFITPWMSFEQRQLVLFDLPARQFDILGVSFWPQDLWLLGWLLMLAAFALFTVTNLVGRLWCGYTCPQTVWTAIFMWIEQQCEGPRHQRIRLDKAPWSPAKLRKRLAKHTLWIVWAGFTGLTFVGYFTPMRELVSQIISLDLAQMGGWSLFWIAFFTAATYINAGWLREQVCIYMCPYARFQSAMIDQDTLIVSYKPARGDPRGSVKSSASAKGDCIDCQLCVQVCPTGIDIRDGLQYQCIGCAHCIDACNQVMDRIDKPQDLISYTTLHELDGGKTQWLRPRSIGYAAVCLVLGIAFVAAVVVRAPMDFDIIRDRGTLYVERPGGEISNDYQLKIMNKSHAPATYSLNLIGADWAEIASITEVDVQPASLRNVPLTLLASAVPSSNTEVTVALCSLGTDLCVTEKTRFLAPVKT